MRPTLSSLCTLALLGACGAASAAGAIAPVTAVVLYPGTASVERTAQVAPGATEVVVDGLPANFNLQTLRVQGSAGIRIGEVLAQDAAATQALNPAEADLLAKIQALKDQQAVLEAESKSAEIVKNYLERYNGAAPAERPQPGLDAKALGGVIDTLGRGASEALLKIQKLAVQQRELVKKIDALQRDLSKTQSGARDTRALTIRLAAGKGGTLTLSYQLNNAGWKPGYRASLDSGASKVDLERLATLAQSTGEDWSNIKLKLSTSQPRQSPVGRDPQPWLLTYRPPRPAQEVNSYAMARSLAAPAAPAPMVIGDAKEVSVTGSRIAEDLMVETQGAFATEFEVPGRISLASGGKEVSVVLSTQTLAVKQHVRVMPRYERFGIVMAEAARPEGVWPAGNMQLFRDGSYIGATQWHLQEAATATFAFGRDDLLKVSLDPREGMAGSKGMFGGRSTRHMADVFTLVNLHRTPLAVVVLEASPVSTSEEIKVQASFLPKPDTEAWEQKRGVVAWNKTLAPNASTKISVEYQIDYPKEGTVPGLR